MNELATRLEEQIISLFSARETQVCQGWILKQMGGSLLVYPLYYKFSQGNIPDNIWKCEEISRKSGTDCVFRIVEHTNYYLSSILTDNGYGLKNCGVVGVWDMTENAGDLYAPGKRQNRLFQKRGADGENAEYMITEENTVIGIRQQEFLFLPEGNLLCVDIEDILRLSVADGITRILADIPGKETLPEQYRRAGFHRAYLYRCYQKEDTEHGFTE